MWKNRTTCQHIIKTIKTVFIPNRYPQAENPPHKQHIYFLPSLNSNARKNKRAVCANARNNNFER